MHIAHTMINTCSPNRYITNTLKLNFQPECTETQTASQARSA